MNGLTLTRFVLRDPDTKCPICLEEFKESVIVIGHSDQGDAHPIHEKCYLDWLKTTYKTDCMYCTKRIDPESITSFYGNQVIEDMENRLRTLLLRRWQLPPAGQAFPPQQPPLPPRGQAFPPQQPPLPPRGQAFPLEQQIIKMIPIVSAVAIICIAGYYCLKTPKFFFLNNGVNFQIYDYSKTQYFCEIGVRKGLKISEIASSAIRSLNAKDFFSLNRDSVNLWRFSLFGFPQELSIQAERVESCNAELFHTFIDNRIYIDRALSFAIEGIKEKEASIQDFASLILKKLFEKKLVTLKISPKWLTRTSYTRRQ